MTTLLLQFLLIMLVLQKLTTPYEYVVSFQQSVICASVSNMLWLINLWAVANIVMMFTQINKTGETIRAVFTIRWEELETHFSFRTFLHSTKWEHTYVTCLLQVSWKGSSRFFVYTWQIKGYLIVMKVLFPHCV